MSRTYVRRRRISLTALLMCLCAVLLGPVSQAFAGQGAASIQIRPVADRTYVVRPGDSLWSIAMRQSAGADPRAAVDAISAANHIDAGSLVPGQSLLIPAVP